MIDLHFLVEHANQLLTAVFTLGALGFAALIGSLVYSVLRPLIR